MEGLTSVSAILKEADKQGFGLLQPKAAKQKADLPTAGQQAGRFGGPKQVEEYIGKIIDEQRITDFGALLKGQDYLDDDTISRGDLFRTIMGIPEFTEDNGLKEGDVMDLLNEYDDRMSGYVALQDIRDRLDPNIKSHKCKIVLRSRVKERLDETIVDKPAKQRAGRGPQREIRAPKILDSVALDICCGLHVRQERVETFFGAEATV